MNIVRENINFNRDEDMRSTLGVESEKVKTLTLTFPQQEEVTHVIENVDIDFYDGGGGPGQERYEMKCEIDEKLGRGGHPSDWPWSGERTISFNEGEIEFILNGIDNSWHAVDENDDERQLMELTDLIEAAEWEIK